MNNDPLPEDLRVFSAVVRKASFSGAAVELGVSPSYVTKRIQVLEASLDTPLLHRTTRRVAVTESGERVYHWALRVLDELDHLVEDLGVARRAPRGALRVCSSIGFGRRVVAPALSALAGRHPSLQVRLEVLDRLVDVAAEGFDLDVRVGDDIAPHLIAKRLAPNHRVLCAAPSYLARRGTPRTLDDLAAHDCLVIKERDRPFGAWRLRHGRREDTVKVRGPLSSNDGEVVVQWAVDGHGVALRSWWDVGPLIRAGRLVQVLPQFTQEANVWAVYPVRLDTSAKVRVCVEFLQAHLAVALQPVGEGEAKAGRKPGGKGR